MRKLLAVALAALLIPATALAQTVPINRSQVGAVGPLVTTVDPSGNTGKAILPGTVLYDSSGTEKGTGSNPLITQAAAGTTNQVQGNVASGATDSGNPVKVGCIVNSAAPTFTAGQRADSQCDLNGNLSVQIGGNLVTAGDGRGNSIAMTWSANKGASGLLGVAPFLFNGTTLDYARGDVNGAVNQPWARAAARWNYAAAASGIVNTTTAVTIQAAAGASVRNYLASCQISHDTLGAVTEFVFRDGASGTVLYRTKLQTTAIENEAVNFTAPLKGTANTLMEAATLTAVTGGVYVNCQGFTGT